MGFHGFYLSRMVRVLQVIEISLMALHISVTLIPLASFQIPNVRTFGIDSGIRLGSLSPAFS